MSPILISFIFIFGAVIGSFLNAVLWRLHSGESIVHGRSHCPGCNHTLSVGDLVPILSWLFLRGKCRYCSRGIGASYIAIEVTVGLLFVAAASVVSLQSGEVASVLPRLLLYWYILATLVTVFVFDLRHMLILRSVTLPATILAAAANLALGMEPWSLALGLIFGGGFFWLQYAVSKGRWIGGGDIHLGFLMGAMLGWPGTIGAIFLAYMVGAVYASVVLASGRKNMKSEIPFGTFLSVAAAAMLLYGQPIMNWYFGLL